MVCMRECFVIDEHRNNDDNLNININTHTRGRPSRRWLDYRFRFHFHLFYLHTDMTTGLCNTQCVHTRSFYSKLPSTNTIHIFFFSIRIKMDVCRIAHSLRWLEGTNKIFYIYFPVIVIVVVHHQIFKSSSSKILGRWLVFLGLPFSKKNSSF